MAHAPVALAYRFGIVLQLSVAQSRYFRYILLEQRATLAQLVEQCFRKAKVPGSNPGGGSEKEK